MKLNSIYLDIMNKTVEPFSLFLKALMFFVTMWVQFQFSGTKVLKVIILKIFIIINPNFDTIMYRSYSAIAIHCICILQLPFFFVNLVVFIITESIFSTQDSKCLPTH